MPQTKKIPAGISGSESVGSELVSVLTPVFNAERYLEQCLSSVLNQSYRNIEHVFADGGSTDRTLEILRNYASQFPGRVKFISEPDNGVGSALNKAYRLSSGSIIGWLDSDDLYEPEAVKTVVDYLSASKDINFIYGGCDIIDSDNNNTGTFIIRDFDEKEWVNVWHYILFCASFFRREVIEKVGFVNDLGNDVDFYLRVAKHYSLKRIPVTLARWRLHDGSISLSNAGREADIRYERIKQDFILVMKNRGSLLSPKALIYLYHLTIKYHNVLRYFYWAVPFRKRLAYHLTSSLFVANRYQGSFLRGLFGLIFRDLKNFFAPKRANASIFLSNKLYNSASDFGEIAICGQRINGLPEGALIKDAKIFIDHFDDASGALNCVVRCVENDQMVGVLGRLDLEELPDLEKNKRPRWVHFDRAVKVEKAGDVRVLLEWESGTDINRGAPRARYDHSKGRRGWFCQYCSELGWLERRDATLTMKIRILTGN